MVSAKITAFGFESRSGKGECATHLLKLYGGQKILLTSFAKALRKEIHDAMFDRWIQDFGTEYPGHDVAMEHLCNWAGVPYDADAQADELNPYGKQRRLQQWWGTEYRRLQFSQTYWLDKVTEEIQASGADLVLIDDMRFLNEAGWVVANGGTTVKVHRPGPPRLTGQATKHVSETALADYKFDFTIKNDGSLHTLHNRAAELYRTILQLPLFT